LIYKKYYFDLYKIYILIVDVFLEVNYNAMRPLDEYMLFTKTGSEKVNVTNSQGVRSAQCASFDDIHKPRPGPSLNISYVWYFILLLCNTSMYIL